MRDPFAESPPVKRVCEVCKQATEYPWITDRGTVLCIGCAYRTEAFYHTLRSYLQRTRFNGEPRVLVKYGPGRYKVV